MKTRIREMREDRDILQKTVAEYLNCDQSSYSKYELGSRAVPLGVLVKLAAFYNTSTDYLLCLTDDPTSYADRK